MTIEETCKHELSAIREYLGGDSMHIIYYNNDINRQKRMFTLGVVGSSDNIKQFLTYKPAIRNSKLNTEDLLKWLSNRKIHAILIGHSLRYKLDAKRFNRALERYGLLLPSHPADLTLVYCPDKVSPDKETAIEDIIELYSMLPNAKK